MGAGVRLKMLSKNNLQKFLGMVHIRSGKSEPLSCYSILKCLNSKEFTVFPINPWGLLITEF